MAALRTNASWTRFRGLVRTHCRERALHFVAGDLLDGGRVGGVRDWRGLERSFPHSISIYLPREAATTRMLPT